MGNKIFKTHFYIFNAWNTLIEALKLSLILIITWFSTGIIMLQIKLMDQFITKITTLDSASQTQILKNNNNK